MPEAERNDLTATLASRGQAPVIALVLILATTLGVLNVSSRPGGGTPAADSAPKSSEPTVGLTGPLPRAGLDDALEALEPLQRFLNIKAAPASLEDLAGKLEGYRITTLIASISDPKDSRLGYDFDMAIEAIQRAVESEGYTLDRFRLPWLDPGSSLGPGTAPGLLTASPKSAAVGQPPSPAPAATMLASPTSGQQHERQPGTILFRIDRSPPREGQPPAPQDLLLLLLVGETPTWGIQQEALTTSMNIAWALDVQRNASETEREPVVRLLAPTFSGTADSLARVVQAWSRDDPGRRDARIWVCSGAATAIDKSAFQRNCLPAKVIYASTVIPDDILLEELYRFMARSSAPADPAAPMLPKGKIALLVESGSGYGSAIGQDYGTNGTTAQSKGIISIPFPSQIAQVRASMSSGADLGGASAKNRVTIPFDPPSGRQSDRLPALSPKMTIATDNLILSNILATIANEDIRYVGIVATDILDVIYLVRLIREHCPDVQVFLVGNDLRYTDPQFTLDFRGTIIASSYPLDARAQVWSYPFEGAIERRLFANEFDLGRYNAGLVLLNAVTDPNHVGRLVVESGKAEDFLVYGRPLVATFFDAINRRPQIWINQVGQFNVWPLKVLPLSQSEMTRRAKAEALIPPVANLNPERESSGELRFDYDFPLIWKLVFCAATFLAFMLVGMILYTNLGAASPRQRASSWFDPLLRRFEVSRAEVSSKRLFLISLLMVAMAVAYCQLAEPLDVALPPRVAPDGERNALLIVGWDVYTLAVLGTLTLLWMLVPLGICLREVFRRQGPVSRTDAALGTGQESDRWLAAEDMLYRLLTLGAAVAGIACIFTRLYRFTLLRPELPNDWLSLDRSVHLLGGISPIVPVACLGAAVFLWGYLELTRLHSAPLLRRGTDLIPAGGISFTRDMPWRRVIPRLNARYRLCVDLLEYPVTILVSKNLPLAAIVASAAIGVVIFVWCVVWPRFIPTPEGGRFDLLVVTAFMCYLLLLLYSQVRYLWLWRSLLQLFGHIALLPMADAFDRIPPRVAAKFGRFLRTSLQADVDLEIPLQQCRLVLVQREADRNEVLTLREAIRQAVAAQAAASDQDHFDLVSEACVEPVIGQAWPRRSLENAYGGSIAGTADKPSQTPDDGIDPATNRWLGLAEDLLALRIVYLVSQFSGPLRRMSAQLIYGPILLLLAVAWYPFHPQRLMTIMIWAFIIGGVLVTLMTLVQVERSEFISRVGRTAPNAFKLDQTFVSNLLPYAVPVVGFLLTAFPSLGYWLGSLLEPISRSIK
jgi:hypothetical protein